MHFARVGFLREKQGFDISAVFLAARPVMVLAILLCLQLPCARTEDRDVPEYTRVCSLARQQALVLPAIENFALSSPARTSELLCVVRKERAGTALAKLKEDIHRALSPAWEVLVEQRNAAGQSGKINFKGQYANSLAVWGAGLVPASQEGQPQQPMGSDPQTSPACGLRKLFMLFQVVTKRLFSIDACKTVRWTFERSHLPFAERPCKVDSARLLLVFGLVPSARQGNRQGDLDSLAAM